MDSSYFKHKNGYISETEFIGNFFTSTLASGITSKAVAASSRAVYAGDVASGATGALVYIPAGKDPYIKNIKSIKDLKAGTFTDILVDYIIGKPFVGNAVGVDYLTDIKGATGNSSVLTHADYVAGVYTVSMELRDGSASGTLMNTYSFEITIVGTTITKIIALEPLVNIATDDILVLGANTIGKSTAVNFAVDGVTVATPFNYGTDLDNLSLYR